MVGILILSHSKLIAEGLAEVCKQMAKGVDIIGVGGTDDGRFGVDAEKALSVLESLLQKNTDVIIYADIGSTIMAAKNIVELSSKPANVHIADAPLVEGSIVGSVEAMLRSEVNKILQESKNSCSLSKV